VNSIIFNPLVVLLLQWKKMRMMTHFHTLPAWQKTDVYEEERILLP
jgi:hypothetical protein